jgi:hypothetical protein
MMTDQDKNERADRQAAADRGARAADDKRAAPQPHQGEASSRLSEDQLATPPSSPPQLGGKQVAVTVGPHRSSVLTMPDAEADQAIADNWAVAHPVGPFDADAPPREPLDAAAQTAAEQAAQAWADAQLPNAQPVGPDDGQARENAQPWHDDQARAENARRDQARRGEYETKAPPRK